jgi:serine/threonine protein kinase
MKQCPVCSTDFPDEHHTCPTDGAVLLSMEGAEWQPGVLIRGKYRILARLGKGGMGIVYKAQHIFLEEFRALKVMYPHLAQDPKFRHRFLREGKEGRKLRNNPHIVAIEDQEQAEDGSLYLAMEYIDGVTLRELLRSAHGPLPLPRALIIAKGIAEGLQAAHVLGIVHRDIKPDNVLMARDAAGNDVAKVADFGIMSLCEGSTVMGTRPLLTAPYASPEQWQAQPGSKPDPRTDLYALGITMYEMLTGRLPFRAENPVQWMHAHLTQNPPPPSEMNPELKGNPAVDALVLKLVAKDVNGRPVDAQAFLRELNLAQSGMNWTRMPYESMDTATPTTVQRRTPASGAFSSTPASVTPASGEARPSDSGVKPEEARPKKYVEEALRWAERNIDRKSGQVKAATGEPAKPAVPPLSRPVPPPSRGGPLVPPSDPVPPPAVEPVRPRLERAAGFAETPPERSVPPPMSPPPPPPLMETRPSPPPPPAPTVRREPTPATRPVAPTPRAETRVARSPAPAPFSAVLPEQRKSGGPVLWISLCLLVVILAGGATYWFVVRPGGSSNSALAPAEQQTQIDAHLQKAEEAFSQGNYDLAIEEYRAVQQFNPKSLRAKEGIEKATKAKAAESVILPGGKNTP